MDGPSSKRPREVLTFFRCKSKMTDILLDFTESIIAFCNVNQEHEKNVTYVLHNYWFSKDHVTKALKLFSL